MGIFLLEHWHNNCLLTSKQINNQVTKEGTDAILNFFFRNSGQPASWFLGLIDSKDFLGRGSSDHMSFHPGWKECVCYSENHRPQWFAEPARNGEIVGSRPVIFTMNEAGESAGLFLVNNGHKGGTSGVLWATTLYKIQFKAGDEIRANYRTGTTWNLETTSESKAITL